MYDYLKRCVLVLTIISLNHSQYYSFSLPHPTHIRTSESIVIRPPEVVGNMVGARNSFASYTAPQKRAE